MLAAGGLLAGGAVAAVAALAAGAAGSAPPAAFSNFSRWPRGTPCSFALIAGSMITCRTFPRHPPSRTLRAAASSVVCAPSSAFSGSPRAWRTRCAPFRVRRDQFVEVADQLRDLRARFTGQLLSGRQLGHLTQGVSGSRQMLLGRVLIGRRLRSLRVPARFALAAEAASPAARSARNWRSVSQSTPRQPLLSSIEQSNASFLFPPALKFRPGNDPRGLAPDVVNSRSPFEQARCHYTHASKIWRDSADV